MKKVFGIFVFLLLIAEGALVAQEKAPVNCCGYKKVTTKKSGSHYTYKWVEEKKFKHFVSYQDSRDSSQDERLDRIEAIVAVHETRLNGHDSLFAMQMAFNQSVLSKLQSLQSQIDGIKSTPVAAAPAAFAPIPSAPQPANVNNNYNYNTYSGGDGQPQYQTYSTLPQDNYRYHCVNQQGDVYGCNRQGEQWQSSGYYLQGTNGGAYCGGAMAWGDNMWYQSNGNGSCNQGGYAGTNFSPTSRFGGGQYCVRQGNHQQNQHHNNIDHSQNQHQITRTTVGGGPGGGAGTGRGSGPGGNVGGGPGTGPGSGPGGGVGGGPNTASRYSNGGGNRQMAMNNSRPMRNNNAGMMNSGGRQQMQRQNFGGGGGNRTMGGGGFRQASRNSGGGGSGHRR